MYTKIVRNMPGASRGPARGGPRGSTSRSTDRPAFRFGGNRSSGNGGGSRGKGSRFGGQRIDPNKFINKAVITEEVVHFVPEHSFVDFDINDQLKRNIIAKGYDKPTPIQDKAIPHILRGSDVVGIANTGTGKTAAFLIPLINKVVSNPNENVLIVVPTRELALQIDAELKEFIKGMKLWSVCCVGGAPINRQISELRYKNNFVIGTPGRLKDLIERKNLRIGEFRTVVLDESDRMLDMGFVADMRFMMSKMEKDRHTLFFSATITPVIEGLIKEFLNEPIRISVKTQDTSSSVDQDVIRMGNGQNKIDVLRDLLSQPEFNKVLIFGRTKHGVEKLSETLAQHGFKAGSIHGNKNQGQRQKALKQFKDSQLQILVATDVAARGLDIANVSHVINYEIPTTYEDYVHRIGRTGRGGKKGKALTFLD